MTTPEKGAGVLVAVQIVAVLLGLGLRALVLWLALPVVHAQASIVPELGFGGCVAAVLAATALIPQK